MANFAQTIAKMPKGQAYGIIFGGSFVISGLIMGFYGIKGDTPRTMQADWKAATEKYMKQQKINPIFGIGRGN